MISILQSTCTSWQKRSSFEVVLGFSTTPQGLVGGGPWRVPDQSDSQQGCRQYSVMVAVTLST